MGWRVQPIVMRDNGDDLTAVDVQPAMIPAAQWQDFKDGGDASAIDGVRVQIES